MSHNCCYSCISISYMNSNTYCNELRNELTRNIQLLLSLFNSKKGLQNFYLSLLPRVDNLLISSQVEKVMWNFTIPIMGRRCCGITILHWRNINCGRHISWDRSYLRQVSKNEETKKYKQHISLSSRKNTKAKNDVLFHMYTCGKLIWKIYISKVLCAFGRLIRYICV